MSQSYIEPDRARMLRYYRAISAILNEQETEWATDPGDMDQRFVANHYAGKLERIFAIAREAVG